MTDRGRLLGTLLLVVSLIAAGIVIGARLWPRVVTIEQRAAAPIRAARDQADFAAALPDLVETACPAVAALILPPPAPPARRTGRRSASPLARDAFFVSPRGYLVTAAEGLPTEGLAVRLDDGRVVPVEVRASSAASGLALLKVEDGDYAAFRFAAEDYPRLGSAGFVAVAPGAQGCQAQATIVSSDFVAERATARAYLRVRPAIAPAVAGAPLVNALGQVMGVALPDPDDVDGLIYLPGIIAAQIVDELMRSDGALVRPFGLIATDLTPVLARRLGSDRRSGAVIVAVEPDSPAAKAGLQAGDVVLSAGDAPIAGTGELSRTLRGAKQGLSIEIARGTASRTFTLSPG